MFGIIWLNYIIKKEYICNILAYDKLAYLQDLYYCSLVLINSYYSINRLVSCKFSGFLSLTDLANNLQSYYYVVPHIQIDINVQLKGRIFCLKALCHTRFQREFIACVCILKEITLVGSNHGNFF